MEWLLLAPVLLGLVRWASTRFGGDPPGERALRVYRLARAAVWVALAEILAAAVGFAPPVPVHAALAVLLAAFAFRLLRGEGLLLRAAVYTAALVGFLSLDRWPYGERVDFLREVARIETGMSRAEVERIMAAELPGHPYAGDLFDLPNRLVYHHAGREGWQHADCVFVEPREGRVAEVRVLLD